MLDQALRAKRHTKHVRLTIALFCYARVLHQNMFCECGLLFLGNFVLQKLPRRMHKRMCESLSHVFFMASKADAEIQKRNAPSHELRGQSTMKSGSDWEDDTYQECL